MSNGVGQERIEVETPVFVPADPLSDARRPLRWTSVALAFAALILALFNAGSAVESLDERPPTVAVARLRGPLSRWEAATRAWRLDEMRVELRAAWQDVRSLRFGSERPGEPGADQR